ncbi:helix-turn-helix transcriptional regulator [Nocardia sp. NBC_01503]|uniref:winged helix-turn-helix transcriptional regulator n=1 Tax=Nocardia sp. NBC_01503 TaxID=2975997 RepID=UPI002E7BCCC9|nr:helix-turn-helix domain-containing protein [Nocardia sp. NBC_01503]WTL33640.1 helix-turn-helix transcriptional regulator [Nocardia sp. NBC_01503]
METIEVEGTPEWDVFNINCPTRQVFDRVGERWTGLVLLALEPGTQRFSELRRRIQGITQKMLTQTLRALERDGIVERQVFATVPVTVEYSLTPLGRSLATAVAGLRAWSYANISEITAARAAYDGRATDTR